jgi:tetratricopeptide (TPR) repeat protein
MPPKYYLIIQHLAISFEYFCLPLCLIFRLCLPQIGYTILDRPKQNINQSYRAKFIRNLMLNAVFMLMISACFKKNPVNEHALLHQRACIESIDAKDYDRARIHCELCLEYAASMPECLNGLGLIELTLHDESKALSFFNKALRQNNDFSQARNNIGVIFFMKGDFYSSLKYFNRALEIDPSNTDARYNTGLSHFRLGQKFRTKNQKKTIYHLNMAKQQIKKLLSLEPTYQHGFRDLGLIELNLYEENEYEKDSKKNLISAKEYFLQCLSIANDDDGCHEGLGQVYLLESKFEQAFAEYFLCLTYAPNNSVCRYGIVSAYEKSAQTDGGFRALSNYAHTNYDNAEAHEAFCAALFEKGLVKQAVNECEIALRLKPNLCSALFRLAEYNAQVLDIEKAKKHCQAFLVCSNKIGSKEIKHCQEILAIMTR